jgi:Zn-finger nucleic acid-binding protein
VNCPVCKNIDLHSTSISQGLSASKCSNCSGHWLAFSDYLSWQQCSGKIDPQDDTNVQIDDTLDALICPCCTKILSKYRVNSTVAFVIDQCGTCSGIWLDQNEWVAITQENLAHKMHLIFTGHWQKNIKRKLSEKRKNEIYLNKFGEENFKRLNDIKLWLSEEVQYDAMLAYLNDR